MENQIRFVVFTDDYDLFADELINLGFFAGSVGKVIDNKGVIRSKNVGLVSKEALEKAIKPLM